MRHTKRWMLGLAIVIVASLQLAACGQLADPTSGDSSDAPVKVEHLAGTDLRRVTLTADAATRLNIATTPVRTDVVGGTLRKVVPYSAILYDLQGATWVYTATEPFVYMRAAVSVDFIIGDLAVLLDGPPDGTMVVMVGGPELYCAELGVGDEA